MTLRSFWKLNTAQQTKNFLNPYPSTGRPTVGRTDSRTIVLKPDRVQVDLAVSEVQIYISLVVDPDDMGLMIGRKGRVAKALRIILQAAAMRHGRRVQVEISPH